MLHPENWPRWLVPVVVAAFWLLVLLAGAINPGYEQGRDFISALASRGADQAWIGVTALVVLPLAHLATAALVLPVSLRLGQALMATVPAGLVVAASRISCPGGAANCSRPGIAHHGDWMDHVHVFFVVAYGLAMVAAMAIAAYELWTRVGPRWFAVLSGVLAPVSGGLLLVSSGAADHGAFQRAWLGVNTGWLIVAALVLS